jgi:hypothetical protein
MTHTELINLLSQHLPGLEEGQIEWGSPPLVTITIHDQPDSSEQWFAGWCAMMAAMGLLTARFTITGEQPKGDEAIAQAQIQAAMTALIEFAQTRGQSFLPPLETSSIAITCN